VITPTDFRGNFPEFADATQYPDPTVSFWIGIAYAMLNPQRWGTMLDFGVQLFVAHNLVFEVVAVAEAGNGAPPGQTVGAVSAKAVDGVSINYDVAAGVETDAGHWNTSNYGTRFIRFARMFGAGPLQVGIGCAPPLNGPAWPGPIIWPPI
jgi:Protein of unknown function (DUF4054)